MKFSRSLSLCRRIAMRAVMTFAAVTATANETLSFNPLPARGARIERLDAAPERGVIKTWRLRLPQHVQGCFFAPDGSKLPGSSNRTLPWFFEADVNALFRNGIAQNPAVARPSR